jgi:hypothetical protein
MVLFNALTSVGIWDKPTRLVLCSVKFSRNCLDCVLLGLRILWYMAFEMDSYKSRFLDGHPSGYGTILYSFLYTWGSRGIPFFWT